MASSDTEDMTSVSSLSTESHLISFNPEDVQTPSSCMSAEMYDPFCTTEVKMVVEDDDNLSHVHSEDGQHDPLMQETFNRLGNRPECDPREWVQKIALSQFPCQLCQIIQSNVTSIETLEFWKSVEETSDLESRCHLKNWNCRTGTNTPAAVIFSTATPSGMEFYKCFIDKLKMDFPREPGIKNTRTLNVLRKLLLRSDISSDTDKLQFEALCRVVRFFGPIKSQNERCVLIQEIHHLIEKSLQYKDKSRKEKVSWFAGDMTRDEAESRLKGQPDFTYLIRMSQTNGDEGDFALSVVVDGVVNHFEIKGQPERARGEEPYSACILFNDKEYKNIPELIEDIRYNAFTSQEDGKTIWCRTICPGLPFNAVMTGYKKSGRQK